MFFGPRQHRAHRRQDLSELIVQFARDVTQGGFLGGNELLGKFAALFGKRRELAEQSPIRANQVKTGEENSNQSRGQEKVDLPLNAAVDLRDAQRRLLSTTGKYQSRVFSNPVSSSITGCNACERLRTLSSALCVISQTSCNAARCSEFSGACFSARVRIAPTAVRICPNSSCNSREM